jgi:hypothetical protein
MKVAARISGGAFVAAITLFSPLTHADNLKGQCVQANTDAQSFRREGRLAEAREQLRFCTSSNCPSLVSADCIKRLDELENAQPSVVFDVVDGNGRDLHDVKVTIDGRKLVDGLEGVAVNVDLGEHELVFAAPDRPQVTQKLVFREGEKARVIRITLRSAADSQRGGDALQGGEQGPSALAASTTPTPDDTTGMGSSRRTVGYVIGGVGLAALAVGGVFGYLTIQAKNRQIENCKSTTSCRDRTRAADAHEDAKLAGIVSTAAFVVGAATTALGIVLVLPGSSRPDGTAPKALTLAPRFGKNVTGLSIAGDW